jgi:hypothetical protein
MSVSRESSEQSGSFVVQWRAVAITSCIVALAAIGALVVVATIKRADPLSTIALALAILAFVIQILVFVAQNWTTGAQMLQSQTLNTETKSLLVELRTSAQGTNAMLNEQFNKLLDRMLVTTRTAVEEAGGDSVDVGRLRQRLASDLAPIWPTLTSVSVPPWVKDEKGMEEHSHFHEKLLTETMAERRKQLRTWPSETEVEQIIPIYHEISDEARDVLKKYAQDYYESLVPGGIPGMLEPEHGDPAYSQLANAGLIVPIPSPFGDQEAGNAFYVLSPLGFKVGRLLIAHGPAPEYLDDKL